MILNSHLVISDKELSQMCDAKFRFIEFAHATDDGLDTSICRLDIVAYDNGPTVATIWFSLLSTIKDGITYFYIQSFTMNTEGDITPICNSHPLPLGGLIKQGSITYTTYAAEVLNKELKRLIQTKLLPLVITDNHYVDIINEQRPCVNIVRETIFTDAIRHILINKYNADTAIAGCIFD